jgi:tryptophan halogenase
MQTHRIRSVLILGGGTAGWMAAAVLARAFGRTLEITLLESEEIGIVGVGEATIPQIQHINQFLGLPETEFLRATQGTYKLGIQFLDWRRPGDRYLHAFGGIGMSLGLTPFQHYWLRARAEGDPRPLWDYSLNAAAAAADRFAVLERLPGAPLDGLRHAYHFDASLYAQVLRARAEAGGVRRVEGKFAAAAQDGESGLLRSVRLEDGRVLEGDLFVDCSGFRGLLIEGVLSAGYHDWSAHLPCDRAVAAPCGHGRPLHPYTQATAREAGWQWRIPLQHRVGNGHVYCSSFLSDDAAARMLLDTLETPALAEPRFLRFTTGVRKALWVKNCVALGLASGFLEPLESTSIHLIQSCLARFLSMFPDRSFDPAAIAEFNRQSLFEFEKIRDFIILHYWANEKEDQPFWRARREAPLPEALQAKIEVFRATGRVHREAEELFTEVGWLQVLLGQGVEPQAYHPLADQLEPAQLEEFLANIRTLQARALATLPTHADWIARHCAAAAAPV